MEKTNEDILSNISNNEELNEINNYELITYDYNCSVCNSIPEITNIDFQKCTIEINCLNHKNEVRWEDFINDALKNNYYYSVCNICQKSIQKYNEKCFKYCYFCNNIICEKCYLNHDKSHNLINNDEYNNKCKKHFNKLNTSFCVNCRENICEECKRSKCIKDIKNMIL